MSRNEPGFLAELVSRARHSGAAETANNFASPAEPDQTQMFRRRRLSLFEPVSPWRGGFVMDIEREAQSTPVPDPAPAPRHLDVATAPKPRPRQIRQKDGHDQIPSKIADARPTAQLHSDIKAGPEAVAANSTIPQSPLAPSRPLRIQSDSRGQRAIPQAPPPEPEFHPAAPLEAAPPRSRRPTRESDWRSSIRDSREIARDGQERDSAAFAKLQRPLSEAAGTTKDPPPKAPTIPNLTALPAAPPPRGSVAPLVDALTRVRAALPVATPASTQSPAPPPPVQISIGRVEVRAQPAPSPPAGTGQPRGPRVSLDDYLQTRGEGRQ